MVFEQALKLVSQSPENFAYHFIIFVCLQISAGLSFWLWRKSPDDKLALRLASASVLLLLVRIIWAFVLIKYSEDRVALAPVERGVSLVAIAYLTWAMAPAWDEVANLRIFGLFLVTIGTGAGLYFAIPDWLNRVGVEAYADTAQAPAWALLGIILCIGCILTLSLMRPFDWILRISAVLPILAALALHFFAFNPQELTSVELAPEITTGIVPVWDRFAWIISIPLMVAIAYRRVMSFLLDQTGLTGEGRTKLATMLEQSVNLLEAEEMLDRIQQSSELFDGMYGTQFVGLASLSAEDPSFADMAMMQKNGTGDQFEEPRRWMLNLADWPFLLQAMDKHEAVQFSPYEQESTRKIYEFHQELHLRFVTPILTIPLRRDAQKLGFILLGAMPQRVRWDEDDREVLMRLGDHIARAFLDHERISRLRFAEKGLGIVDDLEMTAKIDALEHENKALTKRLSESSGKVAQLTQDLKITRRVAEELKRKKDEAPADVDTEALKQEVTILRDALMEAEISLSDSKKPGDINYPAPELEKYSQTITHYSGELELAQQRIEQLEYQLNRIMTGANSLASGSPLEEIRGPLAMIKSYIDLLLIDNTGFLSVRQIDLLQRVQNSNSRVSDLLDRLDSVWEDQLSSLVLSDVDTVFTQAIANTRSLVEARGIKLNLDVDDQFPKIPIGSATLVHVFSSVMANVIDSTAENGTVTIRLVLDEVINSEESADISTSRFLNFSAETKEYQLVESATQNNQADDIKADMDGIYSIVKSHAGRIWTERDVNSKWHQVTILMPVSELETQIDQLGEDEPPVDPASEKEQVSFGK